MWRGRQDAALVVAAGGTRRELDGSDLELLVELAGALAELRASEGQFDAIVLDALQAHLERAPTYA